MRVKYSLATLLLTITFVSATLVAYRYFFPPPAYALPTYGYSGTSYFYAFGRGFELQVTEAALAATSTWNLQRSNPLLSARNAMIAADKLRLRMIAAKVLPEDQNSCRWELEGAHLIPTTSLSWYWEVAFVYVDNRGESGPPNELFIPVLMDGTVVEPKEKKSEDPL